MHTSSLVPVARRISVFVAGIVLVVGSQFAAAGGVPAADAREPSAAPPVVDIMATDFAFEAPDSLPAGLVTLRLMNHGQEAHHAQLLLLNDGVTLDQFAGALQSEGDAALRLVGITGGPGALDPQITSEVTLDLAPGAYVLACFLTGPDGLPHLAKGMLKPLTVTPAPVQLSALPAVAGTITLRDFTFDDVPESMAAGNVTYQVVNAGPQPHEMNVLKLAPGTTPQDVVAWAGDPTTPPPFQALGGMNGLGPDVNGYMTLDLQPGEYAAICNIPDPATGLPHSQLGMIRTFTVR